MASIVQLQYALELARQGGFHKAAKRSFVTQPTLSMQVQKLEEELGIPLFDRSRKPIAPTEQGTQLLAQFQTVVREFERIAQIANQQKNELAGPYRLAVIPTIAPSLLPPVWAKMRRIHPKVQISAVELTTGEIIEQLIEGSIDAGVLSTPLEHPAIHETVLFQEPLYLFHAPDVTIDTNDRGEVAFSTLDLTRLLVLTEGHCLRNQVFDLCRLREQSQKAINLDIEASSLLTLTNTVEQGKYITLLPEMAARTLSRKQKREQLKPLIDPVPLREVGIVMHRSQIKAEITSAILEIARDAAKVSHFDSPGLVLAPV